MVIPETSKSSSLDHKETFSKRNRKSDVDFELTSNSKINEIREKLLSHMLVGANISHGNDNTNIKYRRDKVVRNMLRGVGIEILDIDNNNQMNCVYDEILCTCIYFESIDHIMIERNGYYDIIFVMELKLSQEIYKQLCDNFVQRFKSYQCLPDTNTIGITSCK